MQGQFEQFFNEVPTPLRVQGPDLVIRHANQSFHDMFGASEGICCYEVVKRRDERCLVCPAQLTFADGEKREHEDVFTSNSGETINVMCTTSPIRDEQGKVTSVIVLFKDITQLRELQSKLASIGLLVGSISHGIKGLLTGLDGGIYLVNSGLEKDNPERVTQGWEMVQRNIGRIRSMVMDILYYAKDRELDVTDIDAAALVAEIGEILEKKARTLGVGFKLDIDPQIGTFQGDFKAVRASLLNILENSVEACHSDGEKDEHQVVFTVRQETASMVFEVRDNGIGMDQETTEKIFSLFFSSKGIKGTGLGLFIANKIVAKHGGSITVRSEPGTGAHFKVCLPLEAELASDPTDELPS